MREQIYKALILKYQADMEDALLKIDMLMTSQQPVIVDHTNITGEIDKLLHKVADAKENMATLRQYYGTNYTKGLCIRDLKSFKKKNKKSS